MVIGMLKRLSVLTLVCVGGLLVGCGQKGPLYLPTPSERQVETKPDVVAKPDVETRPEIKSDASASEQEASPAQAD